MSQLVVLHTVFYDSCLPFDDSFVGDLVDVPVSNIDT